MDFITFVKLVRDYIFQVDEDKRKKMEQRLMKAINEWEAEGFLS